jgi:hypothetical protein
MGTLQLSEFRTELQFLLFDRADGAVPDARLNRWINQSYRHVAYPSVYAHREMQARVDFGLVTDQNEYGLGPATIGPVMNPVEASTQILGVYRVTHYFATTITPTTQRNKLKPRGIQDLDRRTLGSGPPSRYAIDGDILYLDPVPTTTENGQRLQLRFWRQPTDLAANGDVTTIPDIWDEVILLGARWRAERDLGYQDRAELSKQQYAALLNEYQERQDIEVMHEVQWKPDIETGGVERW